MSFRLCRGGSRAAGLPDTNEKPKKKRTCVERGLWRKMGSRIRRALPGKQKYEGIDELATASGSLAGDRLAQ